MSNDDGGVERAGSCGLERDRPLFPGRIVGANALMAWTTIWAMMLTEVFVDDYGITLG